MKKGYIIAIFVTLIVTVTIIFGGCYGMTRYMVSCKSCEQYNIDNTELRTHTDIMETHDTWCRYNDSTHTKTAVFYMGIEGRERSNFIGINGFAKVTGTMPAFTAMPLWNEPQKPSNT